MSELNIYQRINAVMKQIEYVQKDSEIQGYKGVSHDQVTSLIRKHLVEHGIVIHFEQLKSEVLVPLNKEKNVKMLHYSGDYGISFVNIDKPEDRVTVTMNAHAMDNGDKAPGKAASYATKMAMLKMFSIETGEDDESRATERNLYTQPQLDEFHGLINDENGLGLYAFALYMGSDVMTALHQTFPSGRITAGKAKVRELEHQGSATLQECLEGIRGGLDSQDYSVIAEIIAELPKVERDLVLSRLDDVEMSGLRKLKNEAV